MMRKYKENELNKDMFFEERKAEKIAAQKKENEERKKKALEDKGLADVASLKSALEDAPIHPSEGGIRE
jgi:hypothetical protein